jgi:FkbM family methyltransferase
MFERIERVLRRATRGFIDESRHPVAVRSTTLLNRSTKLATHRRDKVLGAMLRREQRLCRFYQAELSWLAQQMRPGLRVFEAGGNIGSVAIALALHEPQATIVSFEPDPLNFGLFQLNIALNGCANIFAYNMALGSSAGMIKLYRSPDNFGDHRSAQPKASADHTAPAFAALGHPIPKVSGASFLRSTFGDWAPELVKIDTQGADFEILADLLPILPAHAQVAIEFSPYHLDSHGTSFEQIVHVLEAFTTLQRIEPERGSGFKLIAVSVAELATMFRAEKDRYRTYFDLVLAGPTRVQTR